MQNLWNDADAENCGSDLLKQRVYTSRIIGKEPSLVLHGGGNTSVKIKTKNIFGESEEILYVKGSGWDLATIEPQGFAPVRMTTLIKLAHLEKLSDSDMVREQKAAMLDPNAPAPSVEAILHAIIPYTFVDHTHSDAVVTLTNVPGGEKLIRDLLGPKVLFIPYVMPGFILARKVFEMTRDTDWSKYEAMVLLNHGIFTFAQDAKTSYDRMIHYVSLAESELKNKKVWEVPLQPKRQPVDYLKLASLRKQLASLTKAPVICRLNSSDEAVSFSCDSRLNKMATQGPLTPDHVIHTKRTPMLWTEESANNLQAYTQEYETYFKKNAFSGLTMLDPAPRWVVWPGRGTIAVGSNVKRAEVVSDINRHSMKAFQWAENLKEWKALPEKDIFDVEYWELEQAKLKKTAGSTAFYQGKVVLVTGAASGIGRACVEYFKSQGAAVAALDISDSVTTMFKASEILGLKCDVTNEAQIKACIEKTVEMFGGLDVVVSNAGTFPSSKTIENLDGEHWRKTIEVNLSSHQYVLHQAVPYLLEGLDPAIIIVASKNVPAPGPGAGAYSAAKAGLTQLARVAALELGPKGIRVNIIHPNAVFDTGIWTDDVIKNRAQNYQLSVDEYKKNNILKVEVTSKDVAQLVATMAGPVFAKTTGAQVAIDGGNDRVI